MIIIQLKTDNSGIEMYPLCVAVYNSSTKDVCYLVIKPIKYWRPSGVRAPFPPCRDDAEKYGLDTEYVCKKLDEFIDDETVYTDNPIFTQDMLGRLYSSPIPFNVENIIELIPAKNIDIFCNMLFRIHTRLVSPIGYCIFLSGITKCLSVY